MPESVSSHGSPQLPHTAQSTGPDLNIPAHQSNGEVSEIRQEPNKVICKESVAKSTKAQTGHGERGLAGLQKQRVAELVGQVSSLKVCEELTEMSGEGSERQKRMHLLLFMKFCGIMPWDSGKTAHVLRWRPSAWYQCGIVALALLALVRVWPIKSYGLLPGRTAHATVTSVMNGSFSLTFLLLWGLLWDS